MKRQTLESVLSAMLADYPDGQEFEVIAHTLQHDGQGWGTNDSWYLSRHADKESVLTHARGRWEVFKVNYAPRARVKDIEDSNYSGPEYGLLLEVDCLPWLDVRPVAAQ